MFFHSIFVSDEFHGNSNGQCSMKNAKLAEAIIRWYNSIRVPAWDRLTMSAWHRMRAAIENERREINQMDKGTRERGRVIYIRTKNGRGTETCFNIFFEKKKKRKSLKNVARSDRITMQRYYISNYNKDICLVVETTCNNF